VRLAGRAAELFGFEQGSTSAANDLSAATQIATRMVHEFGFSAALRPVSFTAGAIHPLGEPAEDRLVRPTAKRPSGSSTRKSAGCCARPKTRRQPALRARRRPSTDSPNCCKSGKPSTAQPCFVCSNSHELDPLAVRDHLWPGRPALRCGVRGRPVGHPPLPRPAFGASATVVGMVAGVGNCSPSPTGRAPRRSPTAPEPVSRIRKGFREPAPRVLSACRCGEA